MYLQKLNPQIAVQVSLKHQKRLILLIALSLRRGNNRAINNRDRISRQLKNEHLKINNYSHFNNSSLHHGATKIAPLIILRITA